jgi:HEAT repeat protein
MSTPNEIPFRQVLDALLNIDKPLPPRFLYRLSDIDPAELAELENAWPGIPVWRRQALMEDIEELGGNDLILSFEDISRFALQDPDPRVRMLAVRILWEYEADDLLPIFLNMMEQDSDAEVRSAAASALGNYVYRGEIEELPEKTLRMVEDRLLQVAGGTDQAEVRRHALESLGFSSRQEVAPIIESAYYSGVDTWLASALFAMGRSANQEWIPLVLPMLENDSPEIRMEAARAAGELESTVAVPRLVELLNDEDTDVRTSAIWSLSQIGGEGVREVLEQMYEDTQDEDEAEFIESALDNLAFTEDMELFSLLDVEEDQDQGNEIDMEDDFDVDDLDDILGDEDLED